MVFYLGIDLGQSNDYTALAILEKAKRKDEIAYHIRRLEQVRGEPYPSIISKVVNIMHAKSLQHNLTLIVDSTGVGAPVVDEFRKAGLKPVSVFIHGGEAVTHEGLSYRVPKRDLVGTIKILLQNNRLLVSNKLKLSSVLQTELLNFNYKLDPLTAHDSYGCWREGIHDDLVLAVALAAWYGEHGPKAQPPFSIPRPNPSEMVTPAWRIPGESVPLRHLSSYGCQVPHAPPSNSGR